MKQDSARVGDPSVAISSLEVAMRKLSEARTPDDALAALLESVADCTGADEAAVLAPDDDGRLSLLAGRLGRLDPQNPACHLDPHLMASLLSDSPPSLSGVTADRAWFGADFAELSATPIRLGRSPAVLLTGWQPGGQGEPRETPILQLLAGMAATVWEHLQSRQDLERLVEERNLSLQAVNDELQTFAYIASHDLKNPLTIIKTCVWTLQQLPRDHIDARSGKAIDRIAATVERMRDQIDGMLQMHRLTKEDIVPEDLDLSAMALEILEELRAGDKERRVQIRVDPELSVRGDPTMIMVMMENLLGNAWKYTSKNLDAVIEVGARSDADGARVIFVRDNGAGFSMENAGRLFHVFQRLHPEDEFSGSGIGLASVQRIVNRHGGRIWAESEEEQGATFYFRLPAEIPSVDAPGEEPPYSDRPARGRSHPDPSC